MALGALEEQASIHGTETPAGLIGRMARDARAAGRVLARTEPERKALALSRMAALIRAGADALMLANAKDLEAGRARGMSGALLDRLALNEDRIEGITGGLDAIAALPDPVGTVIGTLTPPSGLRIERVRTPIGVIGIIYESRPNVTADAGALCLKAGNAAILRCGSDSFHSSTWIAQNMQRALAETGLPEAAVQLVPDRDRALVGAMLAAHGQIDVIVPRGGRSLVERVMTEARVPVLAHLEGICHVYVHADAEPDMAEAIVLNAKMRRTGVCGAAETLLIDRSAPLALRERLIRALLDAGCAVRGDADLQAVDPRITAASDADWSTEYLDAIISVALVDGPEAAAAHINTHGSQHTESIVTQDRAIAERFMAAVDSAIVMHNASTQFADGGEFGLGGEIGIATGRLHARGPVGAEQLTTFAYRVHGQGHVRP